MTHESLSGEWFYLEADEPLDPIGSPFWTLQDGLVIAGADGVVLGTYDINGDEARIALIPAGEATRVEMTVIPTPAPRALSTSKAVWSAKSDEPTQICGAMVRRTGNHPVGSGFGKWL